MGKEGEGSSQGTCIKGPLTKINVAVRVECGSWWWVGQGTLMEEKWGQV